MAKTKTPDEIFDEKTAFILNSISSLEKDVIEYQKRLFDLLASEYLPLFELKKDGFIANTIENDILISKIDNFIDKLEKAFFRDTLGGFAQNLLKSATLSGEYYVGLGFKKSILDNLLKTKIRLEEKLGFTPTGRLKKDGYLYRLGKIEQVRQELKNYVINSLTGDVPFLDFQLGFRNLVIGNKRVKGLSTAGSLQRYFDQYAYDSFNQTDAATNSQLSASLNLEHFIYEGSIIKTTRPFCRKRAGKAFTVKETKKWKDDPDLIEKRTKDAYRPLIERGRYRCRHFIKYITEALYNQLTGKNGKSK